MWRRSVPALVGQTKSGKAENQAAGVKAAQQAIDKALAPKKRSLRRPE
jgi:stage V sporulation protein SpoVS